LCKRENFWEFLVVKNEEEAVESLCGYLGITSRSELNGNKVAQERFDEMVKRYEATNDPFQ
jgi:hypothetical protein